MVRRAIFAIAMLALQGAFAVQANACKGDRVLFEDKFTAHDRAWGAPSEQLELKGGSATARPHPDSIYWQWNAGATVTDADICLTVTSIETSDPAKSQAGLLFWVKDNQNFFVLIITADGHYRISRQIGGEWVQTPIAWRDHNAIKKGANQPNTLRLVLKGQTVAIAVNDRQIISFRAQAPEQPSHVGLYAGSAPGKADTWQFTNLKVTNAPAELPEREIDIDAAVFAMQGKALATRDKYDAAHEAYTKAIVLERSPRSRALFFIERGFLASIGPQGHTDAAIADIDQGARIDPALKVVAYGLRSEIWLERKDYDRTIADCTEQLRLLEQKADSSDTYRKRGLAWLGKKNFSKAIADFDQSLQRNPKSALALYARGVARLKSGNAAGNADIAAAKAIKADVAREFDTIIGP